jgi:hypothetical protein
MEGVGASRLTSFRHQGKAISAFPNFTQIAIVDSIILSEFPKEKRHGQPFAKGPAPADS